MTYDDWQSSINIALADRRLLDHPFYRRWEAGAVTHPELASYATQYRYFEAYLPGFLSRLADGLPDGPAKAFVERNLADENGDPVAHVTLFERFATAVEAGTDVASPATAGLLGTYDALLDEGPAAALAGFVAYETQASDIAQRKADGLRRHHGLDENGVSFWAHHATVDVTHAVWARRALADVAEAPVIVFDALRCGANAWWAFLDEREAAAPAFGHAAVTA